ncbi:branched-chain amino acid transaminase [Chelatococcus asaccharovorans]|uniref:Branched-chain-amino-acid aminotransferase n=1 Tax=Chelatococcus asaccharovorans TaxID=28210 RepID=A0A2V3U1N4_9HYPH|nr:branched-chain amino acid transaminase [Chelatococcus asaccharovorans]MBS7707746.1 branched-chain amino acid transaminase [Chelatococcus asaccharovorans]PXW55323.1 branched-chain amino acid aminotransferase [Chelatococcus asaccharovorans]
MATKAEFIWMDGEMLAWADARLHVTSEAVLRGGSVFEGLRGYPDASGRLNLFRVPEHLLRLRQSARFMRLPIAWSDDQLTRAMCDLVRANGFDQTIHLRATAYFGEGLGYGWRPEDIASGLFVFALPNPRRAGAATGIRSGISSWRRSPDNAAPSRIKASANYHNSRLAQVEAQLRGHDVPIMLNQQGNVAESPSSCVFMVREGVLITPPVTEDILESITRDTVMRLARDRLGVRVQERPVGRSEVYICDELFLCGTGHEILPVAEIDGYAVGDGIPGPLTRRLQALYDDCVSGRLPDYVHWLTPVAG